MGITLLICLAIAIDSNGQTSFVMEGSIGKYPIVMLLNNINGNWRATYCYKKFRHDIELEGHSAGSDSIVLEKDIYDGKTNQEIMSESFHIHQILNEWTGSWENRNGISLPVKLKPIDITQYQFSELPHFTFTNHEEGIYTKTRLSGLVFIKDSITRYGKYELQWLHESETKIQSFILLNGFEKEQIKSINTVLREKFYLRINSNYSCIGRHEDDGEYDSNIVSYFISPEFISVEVNDSWYCGGAHPGVGDNSFTINAKTGREVESIDELFWFTGQKPLTEKDEKFYDYIDERSKAIVAILTKLYPVEMRKPVDKEFNCDYSHLSNWDFPSWYFAKKGLYIGAVFPHVTGACNKPEFSFIPYNLLRKYMNKKVEFKLPNL